MRNYINNILLHVCEIEIVALVVVVVVALFPCWVIVQWLYDVEKFSEML